MTFKWIYKYGNQEVVYKSDDQLNLDHIEDAIENIGLSDESLACKIRKIFQKRTRLTESSDISLHFRLVILKSVS